MQRKNAHKSNDSLKNNASIAALSKRQQEVLQRMCEGKSYPAIAKELFIAEATVKYHVKNIFAILQVSNKTQAVRLATIEKLI